MTQNTYRIIVLNKSGNITKNFNRDYRKKLLTKAEAISFASRIRRQHWYQSDDVAVVAENPDWHEGKIVWRNGRLQ